MTRHTDIAEPLWTIAQVAGVLGCSADHVYRLVDSGQLPAVNVGLKRRRATLRFLPADVAAFVGGRRVTREERAQLLQAAAPARVAVPRRVKTRVH